MIDFFKSSDEVTLKLTRVCCANCGIVFAMPSEYQRKKMDDSGTFYCPNGHTLTYKTNQLEATRQQLARTQQQLDQAKADARYQREQRQRTERQLTATRGVVTRVKNRVKNGVCPCCNRHFANLHRHMTTQHPDFDPQKTDK